MSYLYSHPKSSKAADIHEASRGVVQAPKVVKSMSKCPQCHENTAPGTVFCLRCGIPLGEDGKKAEKYKDPLLWTLIDRIEIQNRFLVALYEDTKDRLGLPPELEEDLKRIKQESEWLEDVRKAKAPPQVEIF